MKNILSMFWIMVFLAGCANSPVQTFISVSPTAVQQATLTPIPIIPSEPMPIATPYPHFTKQCLPIEDREVELNEVASGTILLEKPNRNSSLITFSSWLLKDIQTGSEYKLNAEAKLAMLEVPSVSPNRNQLAMLERIYNDRKMEINDLLLIYDPHANLISKIDLHRRDLLTLYWLDDERLIIYTDKYGTLLLINPFTGEQRLISDEFPNLYRYFQPGAWWPVVYSPDLHWAVYYSEKANNGEGPVVYDVINKKTLWAAGKFAGSDPAWSPDGQEVAFSSGINEYQLFLINRDGQAKSVLNEDLPHQVHDLSWSPDGHYIAFWNAGNLMIYDRQKDLVFDTCISGGDAPPDWAPDSKQFIVNQSTGQPLLIDWQSKTVYKIIGEIQNNLINGWMNSIP